MNRLLPLAFASLLILSARAQEMPSITDSDATRAGIEEVYQMFEAAFAAQDADAVAALYTEDAMLAPPNSEVIVGRDAIREYWAGAFAAGIDGVDFTVFEVYSMGDWATELGEAEPRIAGQVVDEVKYAVLWQRVDGEWRLHRDIFNSNRPLPGTDTD